MSKKVCIIGSGASGLVCVKECQDAGFSPVCYEQSPFTGGLWRYHEEVTEAGSVAKSTIINSSKEMSAFSDFPPPKDLPNYCHNTLMVRYFDDYIRKNRLSSYIYPNHKVMQVNPADNYDETGKWTVQVKNLTTNEERTDIFDAIFVATGHHAQPLMASFPGQDRFKGRIIHTHSYRTPTGYEGLKVAIVGIGNSGVDSAVELSSVTSKCYLSTRRGAWIRQRLGPYGQPLDMTFLRRSISYTLKCLPTSVISSMMESQVNCKFDHELYGLKPKHRIIHQYPATNDALPNKILSGEIVVKGDILQFTKNGVVFSGDDHETDLDVVILATGYEMTFPFLDSSLSTLKGHFLSLYKYMFNPYLRHPQTLTFVGFVEPVGALFPVAELQARFAVQVLLGNVKLPQMEEMVAEIDETRHQMKTKFYESSRHSLLVDSIDYSDDIASNFGAKPNLVKYFFTDPVLWSHLIFGPAVAYHYRLDGPNKWDGARDAIMTVNERFLGGFGRGQSVKEVSGQPSVTEVVANGVGHFLSLAPFVAKEWKFILCFILFLLFVLAVIR